MNWRKRRARRVRPPRNWAAKLASRALRSSSLADGPAWAPRLRRFPSRGRAFAASARRACRWHLSRWRTETSRERRRCWSPTCRSGRPDSSRPWIAPTGFRRYGLPWAPSGLADALPRDGFSYGLPVSRAWTRKSKVRANLPAAPRLEKSLPVKARMQARETRRLKAISSGWPLLVDAYNPKNAAPIRLHCFNYPDLAGRLKPQGPVGDLSGNGEQGAKRRLNAGRRVERPGLARRLPRC